MHDGMGGVRKKGNTFLKGTEEGEDEEEGQEEERKRDKREREDRRKGKRERGGQILYPTTQPSTNVVNCVTIFKVFEQCTNTPLYGKSENAVSP